MQLKKIKTKFLGRYSYYYKTIDSTQNEIWRRIKNNEIENGTLIYAGVQTNGIGTHGRRWHTDEENNIAFSFFLELNCNIKKIEGLTIKISEAIIELFEERYKITLEIKEPNDIFYKRKKIGGILTQTKVEKENVKYIVVGIGINTNQENFDKDIEKIATSIKREFGIKVDTKEFIEKFCNKIENVILGTVL